MKRYFLVSLFAIGFAWMGQAQEIADNAIGLRLGSNDGFGTEINYQRHLGGNNRLEAGLGWVSHRYVSAIKLTGLYQWVWSIENNFNWYAGVGGGLGSISFDNSRFDNRSNELFAFVAGDLGIEYNFDFPLILSLDMRPEIGFGRYQNDLMFNVGLGVRYQF